MAGRIMKKKKQKPRKPKSGADVLADMFSGILGDTVKKVRKRKKKLEDT